MKRTRTLVSALLMTALIAFALPATVQARVLIITSNKYWTVADATGTDLGNAQEVCRFAGAPEGCPQGATLLGASAWVVIPGANWLWTPKTTATSSATANQEFTFKTPFYLCGAPQSATLSVAADNGATVFLNGESTPTLTVPGFSPASTATIPVSKLSRGLNLIEVRAKNAANPATCADQYQCNPAGVVVKLTVTDDLDPWPTCKDGTTTFQVGEFQTRTCPAGQVGTDSRVCVCFGNNATWLPASNSCQTPPVTCTGTNGASFNVGATEPLSCAAPRVGAASRTCLSTGQWSAADFSGCALPVASAGAMCRDRNKVEIATCPVGTECKSRLLPSPPRPWYCALFGIDCPVRLQTAEWFCDP
jgi:hypothetical protein